MKTSEADIGYLFQFLVENLTIYLFYFQVSGARMTWREWDLLLCLKLRAWLADSGVWRAQAVRVW